MKSWVLMESYGEFELIMITVCVRTWIWNVGMDGDVKH